MQPLEKHRQVESTGVSESATFGIKEEDHSHIMTILRDTLYSNKILAVLREYASNAWDAHRMAGKPDVPIKITLPTHMDPTLVIQDFGAGLSREDVFQVYTQYGASTKRNDDVAVGMLGIGSKSGFAYADSFTIVSCHGGKRSTYVAVLDESEKGVINLLNEEDCSPDETGVAIHVAVQPSDIYRFHEKAKNLFRYFNPQPEINAQLESQEYPGKINTSHGYMYPKGYRYDGSPWIAVMGCVPYLIDLDQLTGLNGNLLIPEALQEYAGVIYLSIGEVQISASREQLKYGKFTNAALVKKFNALVDEYTQAVLTDLNSNGKLTDWEKRLRALPLAKLKLDVPDEYKELLKSNVSIPTDLLDKMTIRYPDGRHITTVSIHKDTEFVLRDDWRNLNRFHFERSAGSYLVLPTFKDAKTKDDDGFLDIPVQEEENAKKVKKNPATAPVPRERYSWDEVCESLKVLCEKLQITGIEITQLSSKYYQAPHRRPKRGYTGYNPKHHAKAFEWARTHDIKPKSDNWKVATTYPTKDDPYVILNRFEIRSGPGFYGDAMRVVAIAEMMKIPVPTIFAYKATDTKPLDLTKVVGRPFYEWKKDWYKSIVTPELEGLWQLMQWTAGIRVPVNQTFKPMAKRLGVTHPICEFAKNAMTARTQVEKHSEDQRTIVTRLNSNSSFEGKVPKAEVAREALYERYPLLPALGGVESVWCGTNSDKICDYILLVDSVKKDNP